MNYILDIACVIIVLICVFRGKSRGFILTMASVAAVALAFFGARIAADIFTPTVSSFIEPTVRDTLSSSLDVGGAIPEDFKFFGITLGGAAAEASEVIGRAGDAAVKAASDSIADTAAYFLVSIVSFVLILIIIKVIAHIVNFAFKLPVLNFLNSTLGALCGLVLGLAIVFFGARLAVLFDSVITPQMVGDTFLFKHLLEFKLF